MIRRVLFFIASITCAIGAFSQNNTDYFRNYSPLQSANNLPDNFLKTSLDKYHEGKWTNESESDDRKLKKFKENHLLANTYKVDYLLFSGRVLTGDPVTEYINSVASRLLANNPQLMGELSFYTYKSSSPNAFCTHNGIILVSLGLISRLHTEAELAFVLSHEIAHYRQKHHVGQLEEKYEILKGKGHNTRATFEEKLDRYYLYAKNDEMEADSLGLLMHLDAGFSCGSAKSLIDVLLFSYLPYREEAFDVSFFDMDNMVIPRCFFSDSVAAIAIDDTYEDRFEEHPSIRKRKEAVWRIVEQNWHKCNLQKDFLVSDMVFEQVREISRFEVVALDLQRRNYGNAIYNAYLLLKKYPNNEYLNAAVAKALYGLAKYKNFDEYHRVARSFSKIQGESQQLHFFLRQLTAKQLTAIALKYVRKTRQEFPGCKYLQCYEADLMRELVIENELTRSCFAQKLPDKAVLDKMYNQDLSAGMRICQRDAKDFYTLAFIEDLKDPVFCNTLDSLENTLEAKKNEQRLSYKEQEKAKAQALKKYQKYGRNILAKKVVVLDPYVTIYGKNSDCYIDAENQKMLLDQEIQKIARQENLSIELINSKRLASSNISDYNSLSVLKEWMQERYAHGNINFIPLTFDKVKDFPRKYSTNYILYTGIFSNETHGYSYYDYILYDIQTGEEIYAKSEYMSTARVSIDRYEKNLTEFIQTIKR